MKIYNNYTLYILLTDYYSNIYIMNEIKHLKIKKNYKKKNNAN